MMHDYILLHNAMHDLFDSGSKTIRQVDISGKMVLLRWADEPSKLYVSAEFDGLQFYTQNMRKRSKPTAEVKKSIEEGNPIRYTWIAKRGVTGFVGRVETRGGAVVAFYPLKPETEIARAEVTPVDQERSSGGSEQDSEGHYPGRIIGPPEVPVEMARPTSTPTAAQTEKESNEMDILQIVQKQLEERSAIIPENVRTGTNLTVTASSLSDEDVSKGVKHLITFTGTVPTWAADAPANAGPSETHENVPCALDLTKAQIVLTEAHAFRQPRGGQEAYQAAVDKKLPPEELAKLLMNQVEFSVSLVGATIGFMLPDGTYMPHPMYSDPKYAGVASRALEMYCKTPFTTSEDVIETMEELRLELFERAGFLPAQLGERAQPSKREDLWHLQAPTKGSNVRDQILSRQESGLKLDSVEILAPRPLADRPPAAGTNVPRPEFENFMDSLERNLQRVALDLASGKSATEALRLSSAITGVDGQYPLRATVASLAYTAQLGPRKWDERVLRFFSAAPSAAAA